VIVLALLSVHLFVASIHRLIRYSSIVASTWWYYEVPLMPGILPPLIEFPERVMPGSFSSRFKTTFGLPAISGALACFETRRVRLSLERPLPEAIESRFSPSNLVRLCCVFCSFFSAVSSGRIRRRMASSTVSSNRGLLMEDFEVPDRKEY
jgi:hypothetical protein